MLELLLTKVPEMQTGRSAAADFFSTEEVREENKG